MYMFGRNNNVAVEVVSQAGVLAFLRGNKKIQVFPGLGAEPPSVASTVTTYRTYETGVMKGGVFQRDNVVELPVSEQVLSFANDFLNRRKAIDAAIVQAGVGTPPITSRGGLRGILRNILG